jgi:hypothetical protein
MSCNSCKLKNTHWLNDLIPPSGDQISFDPDLSSLIEPFDAQFSGIWRPLIINQKRFEEKLWIPFYLPATGLFVDRHKDYVGYDKFVKIENPEFKNWNIEGKLDVCVDVGLSHFKAFPTTGANSINYNVQQISNEKTNNFSIQTNNVIKNKLNDEKDNTETGSVNGVIPRIDPESNIVTIEVIDRGKNFGLKATNDELLNLFSASIGQNGLTWQFSPNQEFFKYLSTNEYLSLDYTVFTQKMFPGETVPRTGQYSIRISLFGRNDLAEPRIIADTGSSTINLIEKPDLYTTGYITVKDEDMSQEIYALVDDVFISGQTQELRSSRDDIKRMLSFGRGVLRDTTTRESTIEWSFYSGSEDFQYLKHGESLTLQYNIYIYDNLGKYSIYNKTITIIGKNESPGIGLYDILDTNGGIYDLNNPNSLQGTLSYSDVDFGDSVTPQVLSVNVNYSKSGLVSFHESFKNMLSVSGGGGRTGKINWVFQPDTEFLQYLGVGQIVELNYVIEITDTNGAKGYGLVTIIVIGKNEDIETDQTTISKTYTLEPPPQTKAIVDSETITVSDNNNNDLCNIIISNYKYEFENFNYSSLLSLSDDSQLNMELLGESMRHMLYFVPDYESGGGKTYYNKIGKYKWIFNSFPHHFRYLVNGEEISSLKLTYEVLLVDTYGSYKKIKFIFTINGYEAPETESTSPLITDNKYYDYIFGWYRYYDIEKLNDDRYIPGVDFYFGSLDTYVYGVDGISRLVVPEYKKFGIYPRPEMPRDSLPVDNVLFEDGYLYDYSAEIGLMHLGPTGSLLSPSGTLYQYITNPYERQKALHIINTSPYIDQITHTLTDIDAVDYTRDSYGRILPLLSGMSAKSFKDLSLNRFVSRKQEIFYRLAQKYGLSLILEESEKLKLKSKFVSDIGANVKINQKMFMEQDPEQTDKLCFIDTTINIGDIKYHRGLCKKDETDMPIVLDVNKMINSPIVIGPPPPHLLANYIDTIDDYFFHIIDYRLNEKLVNQQYVFNLKDKDYYYNEYNTPFIPPYFPSYPYRVPKGIDDLNLIFHGHGGIQDLSIVIAEESPLRDIEHFDLTYKEYDLESIEGPPSPIEISYYSNHGSRVYLGDIEIDYLRTPSRPKCEPFISYRSYGPRPRPQAIGYISETFYDFIDEDIKLFSYLPAITSYYLPSGNYYASLTEDQRKLFNIDLYNHPSGSTPLLKTHNVQELDPEYSSFNSTSIDTGAEILLLNVTHNGNISFDYPVSGLKSGYFCLEAVSSSGIFDLQLLPDENTISSADSLAHGSYALCLENIANHHTLAKITVSVSDPCDYWELKLSHLPFDTINRPLISKIDVSGTIGFFHPNSGWINDSQYYFKTPMAPYVPLPLDSKGDSEETSKQPIIKHHHYFWYDNEKMYNSEYLSGFNYMVNLSGLDSNIQKHIQNSRFIGVDKEDYYLMTSDFYKFSYNAEQSPIKKSIRMSYIDMDYSYGYPFNNFSFKPVDNNKIIVSSNFGKKRPLAYFDDPRLRQEYVELTNYETINIDSKLQNILLVISNITTLLNSINNQIRYWQQQLILVDIRNIDERNRLNNIINNLFTLISNIEENIQILRQKYSELSDKKDNFFTAQVVSASGNSDYLLLELDRPLIDEFLSGGYIRKAKNDENKSQSILLYRSNVSRNDFDLKINKWGNLFVVDTDFVGSLIDNSKLRAVAAWRQPSLFLNQNNNGSIETSGYYVPYSFKNLQTSDDGNPSYFPTQISVSDSGPLKISSVNTKAPSSIYVGPYTGQVHITTASKVIQGSFIKVADDNRVFFSFVDNDIGEDTHNRYIHNYNKNYMNLKSGDAIKFIIDNEDHPALNFIDPENEYYIIYYNEGRFIVGESTEQPLVYDENIDSSIADYGCFAIIEDPKFNHDSPCIGNLRVKYNNETVDNKFSKPALPIFADIEYEPIDENDFSKYIAHILYRYYDPPFSSNSRPSGLFPDYIAIYDKYMGNIHGVFYSYIEDPSIREPSGILRVNRNSFYDHNEDLKNNYYTYAYGTNVSRNNIYYQNNNTNEEIPLDSGSIQALYNVAPQTNNIVIDSVINSLNLQIETLQEDIVVLSSFLTDTSRSNDEKNSYRNNITNINQQINNIINTINQLDTSRDSFGLTIDDFNYKKIPLTYNLNIPEYLSGYDTHNPFLDMNIFSEDYRFKPTLLTNDQPAQSGYVYFEGLVENVHSSFYDKMQTPYDPHKMWIDIPDNADISLMTKFGKIFSSKVVYSILQKVDVECDSAVSTCAEMASKSYCDNPDLLEGAADLFGILKLPMELFNFEEITLPIDCDKINLCCLTLDSRDGSASIENYYRNFNFYPNIGPQDSWIYTTSNYDYAPLLVSSEAFNKKSCQTLEKDIKEICSKIFQNSERDVGCIGYRNNYATPYAYVPGAIDNYNLNCNNYFTNLSLQPPYKINSDYIIDNRYCQNGPPTAGKLSIKSQKMLLFKLKKIKLKDHIQIPLEKLTFISLDEERNMAMYSYTDGYPSQRYTIFPGYRYNSQLNGFGGSKLTYLPTIDTSLAVRYIFDSNLQMNYPTYDVGIITVAEGIANADYLSNNFYEYPTIKGVETDYFKQANQNNGAKIALKANHNNMIWRNEIMYRSFIPHNNKIHPPLSEYDINSYGNNNRNVIERVTIDCLHNTPISSLPGEESTISEEIRSTINNEKKKFISLGPMYKLTITDNDIDYTITVSLVSCEGSLCYEYDMDLGDYKTKALIDVSANEFDYDNYYSDQGCSISELEPNEPDPPSPDTNFNIQQIYSINPIKIGIFCNDPCPENWFYCEDDFVVYTEKQGEIEIFGNESPFPVTITKVTNRMVTIGRSRESCCEWNEIADCAPPDPSSGYNEIIGFRHSPHPDNYHTSSLTHNAYMYYPFRSKLAFPNQPKQSNRASFVSSSEKFRLGSSSEIISPGGTRIDNNLQEIDWSDTTDSAVRIMRPYLNIEIFSNCMNIMIPASIIRGFSQNILGVIESFFSSEEFANNIFTIDRNNNINRILPSMKIESLNKDLSVSCFLAGGGFIGDTVYDQYGIQTYGE